MYVASKSDDPTFSSLDVSTWYLLGLWGLSVHLPGGHIFPSFPLIPRIPDVENGTHPLSGHTAVTAEQVGSEARQPEEQSDCEGWGWDGDGQVIDTRGYPKKKWVKVTLHGPGSRWGSREQGLVFPWQRACYWQSGFSGEVAQKPPYSRLRSEWTRTGGRSEGGQLFQEVWEELRIQNSIFYRKSDLNEFNQRKVFSS